MFKFDMETVYAGLQVALYGLSGVFVVLILFYFITKLMVIVANKIPSKNEE
jgi:hypothetical protein